jgi:hypothetical protein
VQQLVKRLGYALDVPADAIPLLVERLVENLAVVGVKPVRQRLLFRHLVEGEEKAAGSGKFREENNHLAVAVDVRARPKQGHLPWVDHLVEGAHGGGNLLRLVGLTEDGKVVTLLLIDGDVLAFPHQLCADLGLHRLGLRPLANGPELPRLREGDGDRRDEWEYDLYHSVAPPARVPPEV